jgi:methylated-DNA-[protein]-cysteine S-methyltransferase
MDDYIRHYDSPLGGMLMAGDGQALTGLWFEGQKYMPAALPPGRPERRLPVFEETVRWLDLYFGGGIPDFTPALNLKGTAFRKAVWEILLTVPYGRTITYGEIAERIAGKTGAGRMSAQAVGGAVGHNPVSLIVPCHRVIGADGRLTGYAGGIDRKARLLRMEQAKWLVASG